MLVNYYQNTRRHGPEDRGHHRNGVFGSKKSGKFL